MMYQLSPMESVSCWAFRVLCTKLGANRTYTEMIRAKALGKTNKAAWSLIDTFGEETCHVQLMAIKPKEIANFFDVLEKKEEVHLKNIKGYNLNLGCPSPDVIRDGGGAALLSRKKRVCDLIEAIRKRTSLPISIKIRLGLNQVEFKKKVYLKLIKEVDNQNVANEIIVHPKHARQLSRENFHYEAIEEIMTVWTKDLTLNGGYSDTNLPKQKVAGVMFARAAITDPLLFARLTGNKTTLLEAKKLFNDLCKLHPPKEKYLNYLKEKESSIV